MKIDEDGADGGRAEEWEARAKRAAPPSPPEAATGTPNAGRSIQTTRQTTKGQGPGLVNVLWAAGQNDSIQALITLQ